MLLREKGSTLSVKRDSFVTQVSLTTTSTNWISSSDSRLKDVVEPLQDNISKLATCTPVKYRWKPEHAGGDTTTHLGLIAQEVQGVYPEVVSVGNTAEGYLSLEYTALIPALVGAINELSARVAALEAAA